MRQILQNILAVATRDLCMAKSGNTDLTKFCRFAPFFCLSARNAHLKYVCEPKTVIEGAAPFPHGCCSNNTGGKSGHKNLAEN